MFRSFLLTAATALTLAAAPALADDTRSADPYAGYDSGDSQRLYERSAARDTTREILAKPLVGSASDRVAPVTVSPGPGDRSTDRVVFAADRARGGDRISITTPATAHLDRSRLRPVEQPEARASSTARGVTTYRNTASASTPASDRSQQAASYQAQPATYAPAASPFAPSTASYSEPTPSYTRYTAGDTRYVRDGSINVGYRSGYDYDRGYHRGYDRYERGRYDDRYRDHDSGVRFRIGVSGGDYAYRRSGHGVGHGYGYGGYGYNDCAPRVVYRTYRPYYPPPVVYSRPVCGPGYGYRSSFSVSVGGRF